MKNIKWWNFWEYYVIVAPMYFIAELRVWLFGGSLGQADYKSKLFRKKRSHKNHL